MVNHPKSSPTTDGNTNLSGSFNRISNQQKKTREHTKIEEDTENQALKKDQHYWLKNIT